jgi:hypothetical protein
MIEINTKSLGSRVDLQYVGTYAEIKPVPKAGKIMFSDIGNLTLQEHTGAKNIDLTDPLALQMIGKSEEQKPVDPKDFRGAVWGMGGKIDFTEYQPPPPPDTWFCAFLNDVEGSRSSVVYNKNSKALQLTADVRDGDYQINWGKLNETAAIYYVGRVPAGTKLKAQVSMLSRNQNPYGVAIKAIVRGWKEGWFGGDQSFHEYKEFQKNARYNEYSDFTHEFTVLKGWEDIWVTCEVLSNDPRYGNDMNIGFFKNWKISLA